MELASFMVGELGSLIGGRGFDDYKVLSFVGIATKCVRHMIHFNCPR